MSTKTISLCLQKSNLSTDKINYILAGDLDNQCTASSFSVRAFGVPFLGVYGACSTMAEALSLAALLCDGGYAENAVAEASSHFCTGEKQFRMPLEYGGQRPPSAGWTVTGAGAAAVGYGGAPYITHITTGIIEDKGIKDANNMGAAMAPAFASTLSAHFNDTGRTPDDYDLILSGDLGNIGYSAAIDMLKLDGYDISKNYKDCGMIIFDGENQDTHAGGSGCGCSASVLCSYILPKMRKGELGRVLFIATGALLSAGSVLQGENIPGIAHGIVFDNNQIKN